MNLTTLITIPLSVAIGVAGTLYVASPGAVQLQMQPRVETVADDIDNPAIDINGFLDTAHRAAHHRASRRVSEAQFLKLASQPGAVVLDARSREKFALMHVEGAVNLPFPDIDIESIAKLIPDKGTVVLIYCNNNFQNQQAAFPSKSPAASLNLSTYATLFNYGYTNVFELGPLNDPADSLLPFEGSLVSDATSGHFGISD